jgi:hypothetical protein
LQQDLVGKINLIQTWQAKREFSDDNLPMKSDFKEYSLGWDRLVSRIWTVFDCFEASLITNYWILKDRLKSPKSKLTIECALVFLQHSQFLYRIGCKYSTYDTSKAEISFYQAQDKLQALNGAIITFVNSSIFYKRADNADRVAKVLDESFEKEFLLIFRFIVARIFELVMNFDLGGS